MSKFRVTYTAAKRENVFRPQIVQGQPTGTLELIDTRISFHEEKSVEVEAADEASAIKVATQHLPEGVELSANAAKLHERSASGAATIPTPAPPKPTMHPIPINQPMKGKL